MAHIIYDTSVVMEYEELQSMIEQIVAVALDVLEEDDVALFDPQVFAEDYVCALFEGQKHTATIGNKVLH